MSFTTENELSTFDFSQSAVSEIQLLNNRVVIKVMDVIISKDNSQNREYRSMATDDLTLELLQVEGVKVIRDGYTIYNMDDSIREQQPDTELSQEEYMALLPELKGCPIDKIEKKETDYYMYIDTDNQTEGYTFQVTAREDRQEWERFRNLPQEYR